MEIPKNLKIDILAVLLSRGRSKGVSLNSFDALYEDVMGKPLPFREMGYACLMDFFLAMSDVVRLENMSFKCQTITLF
jgi:hypothetical protein